jgi:hypothetical protein
MMAMMSSRRGGGRIGRREKGGGEVMKMEKRWKKRDGNERYPRTFYIYRRGELATVGWLVPALRASRRSSLFVNSERPQATVVVFVLHSN